MHLCMAGIDVQCANLAERERFACTEERAIQWMRALAERQEIAGVVLLATCNRTELYLSGTWKDPLHPEQLLMQLAGQSERETFPGYVWEETAAVKHLMEVACGLHSRIFHEEQIVTQVGQALTAARSCHATDGVLESLFRTAVSAGKEALSQVPMYAVPRSAAVAAVAYLQQWLGTLQGKRCLIIGNGNVGRLAATRLAQQGCQVFLTLRSHPSGETVVPFGVKPVPYEERYTWMETVDAVISATRSPHTTIQKQQLKTLQHPPAWIMDLAVPRDVEETCGDLGGVTLCHLDALRVDAHPDTSAYAALEALVEKYTNEFQMWQNYRDSVPLLQELKEVAAKRILYSTTLSPYTQVPELKALVTLVTGKTIDMLMGSMKQEISPALLQRCCEKLKDRGRF